MEDHFGVPRVRVSVGTGENAGAYMEAVNFPLADAQIHRGDPRLSQVAEPGLV